jgi:uncharacterized protein (TIGR02231 family)
MWVRALVCVLAGSPACSFSVRAADIPAQLHIDQVTVYREGAIVTRTGSVSIPQGDQRLVIKGLPNEVDAKLLKVSVAGSAVRLGGVEVAKINEGKYVSDAERELRRKLEEKGDARVAIQDEAATAQVQLKLLESLAENPSGSPTKAAVDGANLSAVLATMSTTAVAARKRVREATLQLRTLDREIEKLKADLSKIATQSKESTEVHVALEASAASTSKVTVSYGISDASWHWIYDARLDTTRKHLALERQGEVEQGSGEDWRDVELTLTTAQPSQDVARPVIESLFLDLEQLERRAAVAAAPRPSPAPSGEPLQEVVMTGSKRSAAASSTGYMTEYRIPARVTLLADRESRLFPISDEDFGVDLVARVVPTVSRAAHLEVKFKYERDIPIEAGTMQLYRDGAFVGEAEQATFLPGAEVRMPFGVDERIRVSVRDEEAKSAERGVFGKQTVKETRQRFEITSFHPSPVLVEVIDRVPVSRHSDIHVEILKGATEPTTKELDGKAGIFLWRFDAQPQKLTAIRHFYSVRYPQDRQLEESSASGSE